MADTLTREEIEAVRDYAEMRRDDAWKDVLALCDTALKLMDQQDAWVAEGITAGKETIRKLTEERDAYLYCYGVLDQPRIKKLAELEEELAEAKTDLDLCEAGKERLALSYSATMLERDATEKERDWLREALSSAETWIGLGKPDEARAVLNRAALEADK